MNSTRAIQRTYYLILSLFWLATALPISLNVLLVQSRGVDLFQVGMLWSAYSLTVILLEVPTGGLADAIGRKRVALIAYAFMALASSLLLFAFSFPTMLVVYVIYGAGRALSSGALDAWFVDALQRADPQVDLQPALAKAGTFSFLSLGLGTLLGSTLPLLFKGLPAEGTAVLTPLSMPILFALGLDLMLLLLAALLVKEIQARDGSEGWMRGVSQVPALLRTGFALTRSNPTLALMLAATATCGFALAGLEGFWQPNFAHLLGGSQGKSLFFGVIMGGNFLVGMLGNLLATPISQRLNRRYGRVCAVFQGLWGMSVILLAMQVSPAPAALLFWLAYMNMGVADSPHNTLLNGEIPSRARSSMLSIASLAGYLGAMTGSAGMGYLAEHASIRLAWIIVGLVLVISLTLYWRIDVLQGEKQAQAKAALADAASGI